MSDITAQDRLAGTWNFSAVHSTAYFSVGYLVASFRGSFRELSAELVDGNLRGEVEVRSVDGKDENLAGHLMGPDFFDAERYPTLGFESSSLRIDGDRVEIDGELTVKGRRGRSTRPAPSPDRPRTSRETPGSASPSRPRSIAPPSGSTGTRSCRAAATRSPTRSS